MSKILLIDNYDSFTFNLYHYLEEFNEGEVIVMRNDQIDFKQVGSFDAIVISPGPGLPKQAGELPSFLEKFVRSKKILGVCLGLQAIVEYFEGELHNLQKVVHGQSHEIFLSEYSDILFRGLPRQFNVGRYHSWIANSKTIPLSFNITSTTKEGHVMSLQHKTLPINAVQFHPESILTEYGKEMIKNWVSSI